MSRKSTLTIYVESGGNRQQRLGECRRAFKLFFVRAGLPERRFIVSACGNHSFGILATLNPTEVAPAAYHLRRLRCQLKAILEAADPLHYAEFAPTPRLQPAGTNSWTFSQYNLQPHPFNDSDRPANPRGNRQRHHRY